MTTLTITLPFPSRRLSPNARLHWAAKAAATRKAKGEAQLITRSAMPRDWPKGQVEAATVSVVFNPPDKRARDLDNLIASMKAAFDGIVAATGCDDSRWKLRAEMGPHVPGGAAVVTFTPDVVNVILRGQIS